MDNKKTVIELEPIVNDLVFLTQTFKALGENLVSSHYADEVRASAWIIPIRQLCELVEKLDSLLDNISSQKGADSK